MRLLRSLFEQDEDEENVNAVVPVEYGVPPPADARAKVLSALQEGVYQSPESESDQGTILNQVLSSMSPGAHLAGLAEQASAEFGGVVSSMRHLLGADSSADTSVETQTAVLGALRRLNANASSAITAPSYPDVCYVDETGIDGLNRTRRFEHTGDACEPKPLVCYCDAMCHLERFNDCCLKCFPP
jgi:hypothetical protein